MMNKADVFERLTGIFRKVFSDESLEINDELTANDVDGWDSLTHMLLITEVENSFKVKFRLKDLNKMRNVGDLADIILSKL
jgi:acyl carrier protein